MPGAGHHTAKWDRCVDKVKAKGTGNAYAICTAALGKSIAAGDQVAYACDCGAEMSAPASDVPARCADCGSPVDARRLKAVEASDDGREDETKAKPAGLSPMPAALAPLSAGLAEPPALCDGDAADVAVTRVTRSLRDISAKARKRIKHFAGKGTSFPIAKPEDVAAAAKSIGRAGAGNYDAATLRRNIVRIARKLGPAFVKQLPASWQGKGA